MIINKTNALLQEIDPKQIWSGLEEFAKYAFNKSHAVSYSLISYMTAYYWANDRDGFIEYILNNEKGEKFTAMINKTKELGYKIIFPNIENMNLSSYKIENNKVFLPGNSTNTYDSYVDFLFGEEPGKANLILMGVCDKLCKDRVALLDLVSNLGVRGCKQALYMEQKDDKITNISRMLDEINNAELCDSLTKTDSGETILKFKKRNGTIKEVIFRNKNSASIKKENMEFDLKNFGITTGNTISDLPYVNVVGITNQLTKRKNFLIERGKPESVYYEMKDVLQEYMFENFKDKDKITFDNVYGILLSQKQYDRNTKLTIQFNDKTDIFYVSGKMAADIKRIPSKSMVKMTMIFSPYIARRTEEFIYDFDILSIETVE